VPIRIVFAEDTSLVREGAVRLLDGEYVEARREEST
jgi:hypothetical protein